MNKNITNTKEGKKGKKNKQGIVRQYKKSQNQKKSEYSLFNQKGLMSH